MCSKFHSPTPPRWDSLLRGAWGRSQAAGHGCKPPTPRGLLARVRAHSSSTNSVPAAHSPLGSGVTTPSWGLRSPPSCSGQTVPYRLFREHSESSSKEARASLSAVLGLFSQQLCPFLPGYDIRIGLTGGINREMRLTYAYHYVPMHSHARRCIPTHAAVYPCMLLYTHAYRYIPTHTTVYPRTLRCTYPYCGIPFHSMVYPRTPQYTHAHRGIPTHTAIYLYIPMHTVVYPRTPL